MSAVLLDEVDSSIEEEICAIAVDNLASAVAPEHGSEVCRIAIGYLSDTTRTMNKDLLKSLVLRARRGIVPDMPLARDGRAVSALGENLRDCLFVTEHARTAARCGEHTGAHMIASCQDAGPGWRAYRLDVEASHLERFACERVKVWRRDLCVAVNTQIAVPLIVGEDENDVGTGIGAGGVKSREQHEAQQ